MSSPLPDDERLPRAWVDAWQKESPDGARVARAYLRFLHERRPARLRATAFQVGRWVLVGVALGMGTVYAATGPLRLLGPSAHEVEARAPKPALPPAPSVHAPSPRSEPIQAAPAPALGVPQPPSSPASAPSLSPAAAAREQWQRAARGLRERDFETANASLDELARRGTSAERESAQLVQAQLLLSQARDSEAAQLLRALQASADSSSVRQKSAQLLSDMNEKHPSQRSFAPSEGTNSP